MRIKPPYLKIESLFQCVFVEKRNRYHRHLLFTHQYCAIKHQVTTTTSTVLVLISLPKFKMHSTHNYRHSRRSACDRCRGQKLRCERVNMNGMSCERCLKAQEICITSVNHPTTAILSSNHGQDIASSQREVSRFVENHGSMSLLHKSYASKVKKSIHPSSSALGRSQSKMHSYWEEPPTLPSATRESLFPSSSDHEFNRSLDPGNIPAPVQLWGEWNSYWSTGSYNLVSH